MSKQSKFYLSVIDEDEVIAYMSTRKHRPEPGDILPFRWGKWVMDKYLYKSIDNIPAARTTLWKIQPNGDRQRLIIDMFDLVAVSYDSSIDEMTWEIRRYGE